MTKVREEGAKGPKFCGWMRTHPRFGVAVYGGVLGVCQQLIGSFGPLLWARRDRRRSRSAEFRTAGFS